MVAYVPNIIINGKNGSVKRMKHENNIHQTACPIHYKCKLLLVYLWDLDDDEWCPHWKLTLTLTLQNEWT